MPEQTLRKNAAIHPKIRLLALLATSVFLAILVAASASCGAATTPGLSFRVAKRTSRYVIVERQSQRLVVRRGDNIARAQGVPRYRVVERGRTYYVLVRLPAPTSDPIAAMRNAKAGRTIVIGPGTYSGSVRVPSGVTILGSGMRATWIRGTICFNSNSAFSDLKIGPASAGKCAVYNASNTTSNTSFTRCRFRGGGGPVTGTYEDRQVIWLGHAVSNLTFTDCNVECNLGTENATHTIGYNNVYLQPDVVSPSIDNVLFRGCHFGVSNGVRDGAPQMNVCVYANNLLATRTHGYRNVNFENCVFEAADDENIDYSGSALSTDTTTPNDGYSHVTGCVFKGNGKVALWFSDIVVEGGSGYIEVSGCTFYHGAGNAIAMEDNEHFGLNQNVNFHDNVIDATNAVLNTGITHTAYEYVGVVSNHNTVANNTIITLEKTPGITLKGDSNTVTGNRVTIASSGWYAIDIFSGSDNNTVTGNVLSMPVRDNGAGTVL